MKEADYSRVEKAIHYIEGHWRNQPKLEEVARSAGLSLFHFQKLFQRWARVSPKRFLQYLTVENAKERLRESRSVLDAAYESGLSGPGRLHDLFVSVEAMTPGEYKALGKGLRIEYGVQATPFGDAMAATTARGLCGFWFLDRGGEREAITLMKKNWPGAQFVPGGDRQQISRIFQSDPSKKPKPIKVLLKGAPFQLKVWEALLKIPAGCVLAYKDVAERMGDSKASRAVGTAVGQNPIAYLIPCHRVIRETGVLGDYRWGSARKKALLAWEGSRAQDRMSMKSVNESTSQSGSEEFKYSLGTKP
jgi:AraC family transcriptional regulator, regulatory protein of adaptative response / methylated-DNA-[protein]-cysteine methyltransferase